MRAYAALGVAFAAIQLGAVAVLLAATPAAGLDAVFVALLAVQVAVAALAWVLAGVAAPSLRSRPRTSAPDLRAMVRSTSTIGVLGLLGMAYQRIPVLILAAISGPAAAGWFAGASKIAEASRSGHVALFGAVYPAMAQAHRTGASGTSDPVLRRWSWLTLGGALLVAAALLVTGPALVGLLYGPEFAPSATALAILALALVPSVLATYQSLDLVARGMEAATVRAQAVSLGALVVFVVVLVSAFGWVAGCWAVLAAETLQAGLFFAVRRGIDRPVQRPRAAVQRAPSRPAGAESIR
jgi:O-antigen/teichoic acid export membrane protein